MLQTKVDSIVSTYTLHIFRHQLTIKDSTEIDFNTEGCGHVYSYDWLQNQLDMPCWNMSCKPKLNLGYGSAWTLTFSNIFHPPKFLFTITEWFCQFLIGSVAARSRLCQLQFYSPSCHIRIYLHKKLF